MAPERLQLNSFAPGMPPDPRAAWTELQREEPLPVVITEAVEATAAAVEPDIEVHDGIARLAAAAAPPASGESRKRRGGSANAA